MRFLVAAVLAVVLMGPSAAFAQVACGTVVGKGEKLTLTADLGPCDGVDAGIVVAGGSVDLGGRTVSCADLDGDGDLPLGVVLTDKKSKLRNGTVIGCSDGVGLGGDGKHVVTGVTVRDSGQDGFDNLPSTGKCKLIDVTAIGNADDGMQLRGDKNKVVRGVSTDNGDDGIEIWESGEKNKLIDFRAERNQDEGILVLGSKNKITKPTANQNATVGIDLNGTANKVSGGSAQSNGVYDLANCDGNKVKKVAFTTATPDCQ